MSSPKLEILEYCETPIGLLCLRRRELLSSPGTLVTEVTIDHEFLMSSYHTESERALASVALDWHEGSELDVLVGGLGLGYTAHEALELEQVAQVEVVELLKPVITWMRTGMVPLSETLESELEPGGRLTIRQGDVYGSLLSAPQTAYDLILIDEASQIEDAVANIIFVAIGELPQKPFVAVAARVGGAFTAGAAFATW